MQQEKLTKPVIADPDYPVAETKQGKVRGMLREDTFIFRGIKYADAGRFQMPREVQPWAGIRAAVTLGYSCPEMQPPDMADAFMDPHFYTPQDENCQYLNIWTPTLAPDAKKAVMVFVHGGGWTFGSANEQMCYDGEELSKFGDVVVVSFNHRTNCLGALDLSGLDEEYAMSGYCALGDIVAALRWIHENIAAFGGDNTRILLFGQSGGVSKIFNVMQCPEADGLYQKAAVESGGTLKQDVPEGWTKKKLAVRLGELAAQNLHLTRETMGKIGTVPYRDLAGAATKAEEQLKAETGMKGSYLYEPVPDGNYVVQDPLLDGFRPETKDIPMLFGSTFSETGSNMPSAQAVTDGRSSCQDPQDVRLRARERFGSLGDEILAEYHRVYPADDPGDVVYMEQEIRTAMIRFAKERTAQGGAAWMWLFKKKSPLEGGVTAWHCSELPYVFHNTSYIESAFDPGTSERLEETMAGAWVNFAKTGDPNGPNVPAWPKVSETQVPTMIFDRNCEVRTDHDARLLSLIEEAEDE